MGRVRQREKGKRRPDSCTGEAADSRVSAGGAVAELGAGQVDDVEMDPAAAVAAHGPVFGGAAGNHAQQGEPGGAFRAAGSDLRRPDRIRLALRDDGDHDIAGHADGIVMPYRCGNRSIVRFASLIAASGSDHAKPMSSIGNGMPSMTTGL